jgi:hypothetical protein
MPEEHPNIFLLYVSLKMEINRKICIYVCILLLKIVNIFFRMILLPAAAHTFIFLIVVCCK